MNNWKQYIDENQGSKFKRRINKFVFCKKNKIGGGRYGYHQYDPSTNRCKFCNRFNKQTNGENDEKD